MSIDLTLEPLNGRVVDEIRLEMTRQHLSQVALGDLMGRTQNWISERLTGKRPLKLVEVEEIAHALGVSPDLLLVPDRSIAARRRKVS